MPSTPVCARASGGRSRCRPMLHNRWCVCGRFVCGSGLPLLSGFRRPCCPAKSVPHPLRWLRPVVPACPLDFYASQRSDCLLCLPYGLGDAAAIGKMVVFNEDGIVQAHAVVHPPPALTAYFCRTRSSGMVLRLHTMSTL